MDNIYVTGALWAVTGFLVLGTLAPLTKIRHGAIQGFAFPREQFFALAVALLVAFYFIETGTARWVGMALVALAGAAQLIYIVKFTFIWPRQSVKAKGQVKADRDRHVSVLASNVKMSNRQYDRLINLARSRQPDVLMAIEVDQPWIDALAEGLDDLYPYRHDVPRDTGYGLCLLSRLPVEDTEVREVVTEGVPSIKATMKLRNGERFRLYVVHPEPPILGHDTLGRDSEIAQIGIEAEKDPLPAIVTGDLNDVAWSETTRRFQRLSGLLDPRVGRGFYNTFSATMPWMRWPLDHLFHDPRFRLVEMGRAPKIGSDHFPMWFVLALAESEKAETDPGECDPEEREEVKEMITNERDRPREPIGTDWEVTD